MSATLLHSKEVTILSRVFDAKKLTLSPEAAHCLLAIDFPLEDKKRMRALAAKSRQGNLSEEDEEDIDIYGRIGSLLSILKSKARQSLKQKKQ